MAETRGVWRGTFRCKGRSQGGLERNSEIKRPHTTMQGVLVLVLLVIPACFAAVCSPVISSFVGQSNAQGYVNSNNPSLVSFRRPRQMVLDPDTGDLYVADSENFAVRKINYLGATSTLFSVPNTNIWGIAYNPSPKGLFMTLTNKVIFYDLSTNTYQLLASNSLGVIYNGIHYDVPSNRLYWTAYFTRLYYMLDPLSGSSAAQEFYYDNSQSWGLLVYNSNFYFGSTNKVVKYNLISSSDTVLAGSTTGYLNGAGNVAQFSSAVTSFALAPNNGSLYVTDFYNSLIRRVEFDGTTSTAAGVYQTTTFTPSSSSYSGSFALPAVIYAHPLLSNFYYVSDEYGVRLWYWSPPLISNIASSFLTSPYRFAITWVNLVPSVAINSITFTWQIGSGEPEMFTFAGNINSVIFPAEPQTSYKITVVANNACGPSNILSITVQA